MQIDYKIVFPCGAMVLFVKIIILDELLDILQVLACSITRDAIVKSNIKNHDRHLHIKTL